MSYNNPQRPNRNNRGRRNNRNRNNPNSQKDNRNNDATLENTSLLSSSSSSSSSTTKNNGPNKRIRNDNSSSQPRNNKRQQTKDRGLTFDVETSGPINKQFVFKNLERDQQRRPMRPSRYEGSNPTTQPTRYRPDSNKPGNRFNKNSKNNNDKNSHSFALPLGPKGARPPPPQQSRSRYNSNVIPQKQAPVNPPTIAPPPRIRTYPKYQSLITQKRSSSIYERILQVGEGTYGKVYKAKNTLTNHIVALKRLRLQNERDGFPITSIREIKLLQSFNHPNVSSIKEIMIESSRVIYMIFEYADNDLSGILLSKKIHLNDSNRKHIFKQLLEGCQYLHDNCSVIHRDIKGSNILIDNSGQLRITDFGLARKFDPNSKTELIQGYTNRVITLWYRPPELLLGTTHYTTEVDMWGCGCLLLELFITSAIFQGTNEIETITNIFKLLGTPTTDNFPNLFQMPWFFMVMSTLSEKYVDNFDSRFDDVIKNDECLKLARGLLNYDQKKRLTAKQALESPYFIQNPLPEPLTLTGNEKDGGCHEYEVKLAKKQQREKERSSK